MNKLNKLFLICLLLLSACTVKTEILIGDDEVITIHSKTDALVTVVDKERTITVNNQGKPTLFETIITMMFMNTQIKTDIEEE
ncbi:hypothetical protein KAR91_76035 [Candidatus Pacearchaeota archaeon]|nr:hypothetical protein [Candidatus Pacearchaeota archaeon]